MVAVVIDAAHLCSTQFVDVIEAVLSERRIWTTADGDEADRTAAVCRQHDFIARIHTYGKLLAALSTEITLALNRRRRLPNAVETRCLGVYCRRTLVAFEMLYFDVKTKFALVAEQTVTLVTLVIRRT